MIIGENIRRIREQKNISQRELGNILGVSQQMVGQYENSSKAPRIDTLQKIASALGVELFDLLASESQKHSEIETPTDEEIEKFQDLLKKANAVKIEMDTNFDILIKEKTSKLNNFGKQKVLDYTEDLLDNQKYKKED